MSQTTVVYDTHAAVRRLTEAGLPESQAEAMVREQTLLLEHNLATKTDIEVLRQETKGNIAAVQANVETLRQETKADIETLRQETKTNIETLRQETKSGIETLRQETRAEIATVRADVEKLGLKTAGDIATAKNSIIVWVVGLNMAMVGLMIAGSKLL